jgi:NAD+ synthase (glutamine-hydrolysing)
LDQILEAYIDGNTSGSDMQHLGFDQRLISKIIRLVNLNEYKRKQAPPVIRITGRCFGDGRRMPIVAKWAESQ